MKKKERGSYGKIKKEGIYEAYEKRVYQLGGSLVFPIPLEWARELGVEKGSKLICIRDKVLTIHPAEEEQEEEKGEEK